MIPELLTKIKNKVKESPHLPYKSKEIMYHILKKVWLEHVAEMKEIRLANEEYKKETPGDSMDLPDILKNLFRDRSKQ